MASLKSWDFTASGEAGEKAFTTDDDAENQSLVDGCGRLAGEGRREIVRGGLQFRLQF